MKTATQGQTIGFDGSKQVKGRSRHGLVDTLGPILMVVVTAAANVSGRQGLKRLLTDYFTASIRRLRKLWAEGVDGDAALIEWVRGLKRTYKLNLDVVEREGS